VVDCSSWQNRPATDEEGCAAHGVALEAFAHRMLRVVERYATVARGVKLISARRDYARKMPQLIAPSL
jgi:hypothetical protein